MRINGRSGAGSEVVESVDSDVATPAATSTPAVTTPPAGASANSSFDAGATATGSAAATATQADAGTVRAASLNTGATLDAARTDGPAYKSPENTSDLAKLMTGGDEGQPPLSKEQIVDTVLTAFPADQQVAVRALINQGVTDASLAQAFNEVMAAHNTPGEKALDIELTGFVSRDVAVDTGEGPVTERVTEPAPTPTRFSTSMTVDASGKVNGRVLAADTAAIADMKPYPNGDSATRVKSTFEVLAAPTDLAGIMAPHGDQPGVPKQAIIDTVLAALPEGAQRDSAKALIAAGVTEESLAQAFSSVIDARKSPGSKKVDFDLVGLAPKTVESGWGDNYSVSTVMEAQPPTHFSATVAVDEAGLVNGAKLPVDQATEVTTKMRKVPQEFKDATLKDVGFSDEWMANASQEMKDYAVARIIDAKANGKDTELDLSFDYSQQMNAGEDTQTITAKAPGRVSLKVTADGKVNGKKLTAEIAYVASRTVEAMSPGMRRATLQQLNFTQEAINNASADQVEYALTKVSTLTASPGDHQFEVHMGGKKYAVGVKIGEDGSILGCATQEIPPPPKKSWWKTVVSIVCVVVSIVYPPAALICQAIQGAIAISSGAKGLGLLAAVVGVGAGVASLAGMAGVANAASTAQALSTASKVIYGVNTAVESAKSGNVLGAIAGGLSAASGAFNASAAGTFGSSLQDAARASSDIGTTLKAAADIANDANAVRSAIKDKDVLGLVGAGISLADSAGIDVSEDVSNFGDLANSASSVRTAIQNRDVLALVSAGAGTVNSYNVLTGGDENKTVSTIETIADTAIGIRDGNYGAATRGVMDLLGIDPYYGPDVPASRPGGPNQSDVRKVDNAIAAESGEETTSTSGSGQYSLSNGSVRLGDSRPGVRLGTGDDGSSISTEDPFAPVGQQADIRKIDNAIAAAAPQTRADFDRVFAGARANGAQTFSFDYNDGRGPQLYTTGYREDAAAKIPGGSTAGYRAYLKDNGLRDNDSSMGAYRESLTPKRLQVVDAPPGFSGSILGGGGSFLDGQLPADVTFGLPPANAPRVNNIGGSTVPQREYANTGSDFLDSLIDRVTNIGLNLHKVATQTDGKDLIRGARALYDKAVSATADGFLYLDQTSAGQMATDFGNMASKAANDPIGTAWKVFNTVVPVGHLYDAVEKLGDREMDYQEAAVTTFSAGMSAVGVVGAGALIKGGIGLLNPARQAPLGSATASVVAANERQAAAALVNDVAGDIGTGVVESAGVGAASSQAAGVGTAGTAGTAGAGSHVVTASGNAGAGSLANGAAGAGSTVRTGLSGVDAALTPEGTLAPLRSNVAGLSEHPSLPGALRIEGGPGLALGDQGALFAENGGWIERATAARSAYVKAMEAGDGAAAAQAADEFGSAVNGLGTSGNRFNRVTAAATTPESTAAIRETIKPRMVVDEAGAAHPVTGASPGSVVVEFQIVEDGRRITMTSEIPAGVRTPADAAGLVESQFANARLQIQEYGQAYQSLARDPATMASQIDEAFGSVATPATTNVGAATGAARVGPVTPVPGGPTAVVTTRVEAGGAQKAVAQLEAKPPEGMVYLYRGQPNALVAHTVEEQLQWQAQMNASIVTLLDDAAPMAAKLKADALVKELTGNSRVTPFYATTDAATAARYIPDEGGYLVRFAVPIQDAAKLLEPSQVIASNGAANLVEVFRIPQEMVAGVPVMRLGGEAVPVWQSYGQAASRTAATAAQVETASTVADLVVSDLSSVARSRGVGTAVETAIQDNAKAVATKVAALEKAGEGPIGLATEISDALLALGASATPESVAAAVAKVVDPAYRAPGTLSKLFQDSLPEFAAKLKSASPAVVDQIAPKVDQLLVSLDGNIPPELRRAIANAGPANVERVVQNAQVLVDSGQSNLLVHLARTEDLKAIAPGALTRFVELGGAKALAPTPELIAALRAGPSEVDALASRLSATRDSAAAATRSAADVQRALGLPSQFPMQQWSVEALAAFQDAPAAIRQQLASGRGPVWDALKESPAAKQDPAAAQALVRKLGGGQANPAFQSYGAVLEADGPYTNFPTLDARPSAASPTITGLTTGGPQAQGVREIATAVQNWQASGSRLDLDLYGALTNARHAVDEIRLQPGFDVNQANVVINNGRSTLTLSPKAVSIETIGDLEFIGMDESLAGTLGHEVLGHVNDFNRQAGRSLGATPLQFGSGSQALQYGDLVGYLNDNAATRNVFLQAAATGDTQGLRTVMDRYTRSLDWLGNQIAEIGGRTDEALSLQSSTRIRNTITPQTDATGRVVAGNTPNTFVARFEVLVDGKPTPMSSDVPYAMLDRPQDMARLVQQQLVTARQELPSLIETYDLLVRDQRAMVGYVQGLNTPQFTPIETLPLLTRNSVMNVATQQTSGQAMTELLRAGFTRAVRGNVEVYTRGTTQYTFYQSRGAGIPGAMVDVPTAEKRVGGKIVSKIRFGRNVERP